MLTYRYSSYIPLFTPDLALALAETVPSYHAATLRSTILKHIMCTQSLTVTIPVCILLTSSSYGELTMLLEYWICVISTRVTHVMPDAAE
jgi:hypothetical protein